tara:strand:+ start:1291 stop:1749 length:459 start_codon:yes stop_codon:yes gene_type:complete
MEIETLKDILNWTQKFHQHLNHCLTHCADENMNERSQMLLTYLADHEKTLSKVIEGFLVSGQEHALNTWSYEYVNKQPIVQHVHCDAPFAALDSRQIIDVIVDQHQQVIDLYRYLSTRADIPSAKELLESLKSLEEHEIMRMVHSANRLEDM